VVRVSGLNGKGERILDKKGNLPQASPVEALVAFECSENRGIRVRQINDGAVVGEISCGSAPNWSPDGKIVSFFYSGNIWAMDTHGKSKVQLTDESGKVRREGHSWSPDGTKMVFYVEEPNRSGYKIVCVDVKRIRSSLGITP
jgi:Tol biopolymer transport system component